MDKQLNDLMGKIKNTAHTAGNVAAKAATASAQKAGELFEITKNNIKIMNVEKEIDEICAGIGMLIYDAHKNPDADTTGLEGMIAEIDQRMSLISELKERDSELRNERICGECGVRNAKDALFCSRCGGQL